MIDAVSFVVSAVLLGSIPAMRAGAADEGRPRAGHPRDYFEDYVITRDLVIRAFTLASMAQATLWGVFGAIWIVFAVDELGLGAAAIGIIAGFAD